MATTIKLKNGSGAPLAGDLVQGEPALDLTNKRLYSEDSGGTVIEIGTNPSTIDINAGTIDGTVIGGASAAAGTFTNLTATGTVTLPANGVSGNAIDGGTISNFASTGIDDNATSTALTVTDSGIAATLTTAAQPNITSVGTLTGFTSTGIDDNATSTAITIDSSQNVGIGTTSPSTLLHLSAAVSPTISLEDNDNGFAASTISATNGGRDLTFNTPQDYFFNQGGSTKVTILSGGNVGIGLSPSYRLDVAQTSRIAFDLANSYTLIGHYNAAGSAYATSYQNALVHYWQCSGTSLMHLASNGDLHADGNVIAYSTTVSDERLKDDVATIDSALDKVSNLRGVTYTWNKGSREGKRDLGVIAQEVEAVIPEIVHEQEMPLLDGETYKTVDYEKLCAVLIEAVKELKAEVDALKGA